MSDKTSSDGNQEKKLMKATDLPIHGNPYPSKDVVVDEHPGMLESKIASLRTILQPYVSPIGTAYEKTSDVVSIGMAHSQSLIERLGENQSHVVNASIIAVSSLIGVGIARKGGILKKLTFGSIFFAGAWTACYPKDAEEKGKLLWYIAKNKLPVAAKQQYEKFTDSQKTQQEQQSTEPKVLEKESKN